jgi:hypothetical protein
MTFALCFTCYLFCQELEESQNVWIKQEEPEGEKGPEEGGGDEAGSTVQEKNKQVEQLPNVILVLFSSLFSSIFLTLPDSSVCHFHTKVFPIYRKLGKNKN